MRKLLLITASIFMLSTAIIKAQITLDTIVHPMGLGFDFYPVQISKTETKYLVEDTITNTFNLYNMDFTPFLLNIAVPQPFDLMHKNFNVFYVSRTLFDCDSTNIEYAYAAQNGGNNPFYIMRTDGTQLFRLDSALTPYVFGCLNGSQEIRPIMNTSSGPKLFLYHPTSWTTTSTLYIYSLCGTLPEDVFDFTNQNKSFVKIFPNPTANSLTFKINPPDNMNEYELVIIDNNAKELKREKINKGSNKYTIDVSAFSSGAYFYSLCTKNKAFQTGKFIINK